MGWMTSRHAILAALRRGTGGTLYVTGSGPRNRELVDAARQGGVAVETVDGGWLRRHAGDRARGAALQTQETAGASPTVDLEEEEKSVKKKKKRYRRRKKKQTK